MKNHYLLTVLLLASLGFLNCGSHPESEIPYPSALVGANIQVAALENVCDQSLIIGNGDINALVWSDSGALVLNLTKNDVWDARLETVNDPPIPTLDLIKQLGKSGTAFPLKNNNNNYVLPEGMSWDAVDSYHAGAYPCPRQCARLVLLPTDSSHSAGGELDLQRAMARVFDSVTIRALADQNAFLIKSNGNLRLEAIHSEGLPPAETGTRNGVYWLKQQIPGDLDWPGMTFAVAAFGKNEWKTAAIVTSLEAEDVVEAAVTHARNVLKTDPETLIARHDQVWQQFWSKSGISLKDSLLQQNWYRSLYFLRCVSKPGVQSVGLFAGLIDDTPAWHGDYHTNYNIQQTFWGALAANHPDLCEPYDRLMLDYLPRAKWLSQKVFSLEGAYYPHVLFAYEPPDPTTCKSRNGRQYIHHTWGMTIGVNGFSVQPLWWRYKYDPDPARLRNVVYPALREVALFYAEFIENCPEEGTVRLGPSVSPEHWGWTKNLERNYDCTFDIALIRYTLKAAIEAAGLLGEDAALADRLCKVMARLPDYPETDTEPPIVVDVAGAPPIRYNIPVPTTPVFPGDGVTWWSEKAEKQRFTRTIDSLRWNGNNATVMLAIARARLSLPGTRNWLRREIQKRLRSNGTLALNTLEPPHRFNDFGHYTEQFGVGMAISELLLQSVDDIIRIFPALAPNETASFTNLRTQGGFLVSAQGTPAAVEQLEIHSLYGGSLKLASPWKTIQARPNPDVPFESVPIDARGIIEIATQAGERWEFREK